MTTRVAGDFDELDPVRLVDLTEGRWSVIFSPGGPLDRDAEPYFAEHGLEGNGYDWSGAVQAVLTERDAELVERLHFDPEAGMVSISVSGDDLDALHLAASTLRGLLVRPVALAPALSAAARLDLLD
jgi:hypothetical protein